MRSLLSSHPAEVDVTDAYAIPGVHETRSFVRCNMISTFDGAITAQGRSGLLGGPADRKVFQVLRSLADVIIVGAGTARQERYGPALLDPELRRHREERGQSTVPPIAVITRSGNLDWSSPFFTEAEVRPIIITVRDCDPGAIERGQAVAEFIIVGEDRVDPSLALDHLERSGYCSVLLEGGPTLNAQVLQAGRLDELCLTISPRLVSGSGPRVFSGPETAHPVDLEVVHVLEEDGFFFYRLALTAKS